MMKTVLKTCAASALLLASQGTVLPAYAQDNQMTDDTTVSAVPTKGNQPNDIFVRAQQNGEINVGDFMGASAANYAGEEIGDVNDIVVSKDGKISAVVIGVGGFLGMGERDVAVRYQDVKLVNDPASGTFSLRVDTTKDQLAAAPEFLTVAEKLAMKRAEEAEKANRLPLDLNNQSPSKGPKLPGQVPETD